MAWRTLYIALKIFPLDWIERPPRKRTPASVQLREKIVGQQTLGEEKLSRRMKIGRRNIEEEKKAGGAGRQYGGRGHH